MKALPAQLRYHADRAAIAGNHASALFCLQAANEIDRLRGVISNARALTDHVIHGEPDVVMSDVFDALD
jgi:hypothetical protein